MPQRAGSGAVLADGRITFEKTESSCRREQGRFPFSRNRKRRKFRSPARWLGLLWQSLTKSHFAPSTFSNANHHKAGTSIRFAAYRTTSPPSPRRSAHSADLSRKQLGPR